MANSEIHLYVGKNQQYKTIGEALAALEALEREAPAFIHIGEGIYRERLEISRPKLTLVGEGADKTIIVYGLGAYEILEDGLKRGTFRTYSVYVDADDFTAEKLCIKNEAGFGSEVGQALAVYVDGDRSRFIDCSLCSSQDTLFMAPLPHQVFQPRGFVGPGEFKERRDTRQYYENCYIRGDVDFIFGGAMAWFEKCTIFSQKAGKEDKETEGYIAAPSTFKEHKYGFVFNQCRLVSDCKKATVYLGRPWREWGRTVYLNCEMGDHIKPEGWNDWGKDHEHFFFAEYRSFGPGANPEGRADFSHQLTDEEAKEYTVKNVLGF
ncbi:MAG: pectinesterase family protein [Lachnospiraceae bacterium]|nr:pectinesterase family protein [Lachnospiraceae bacterium]